MEVNFEWDERKDQENQEKHGISFQRAQYAFADKKRIIVEDVDHSIGEKRYFCFGKVGEGIATVRFTHRNGMIRLFGAGYWRAGRKIYEKQNKIH